MSIFCVGKFLGLKSEHIAPEGKPSFDTHSIGLSVDKAGGFPGETETLELRATKQFIDAGGLNSLKNTAAGTRLQFAVTVGARAYQGRGYSSFYAQSPAKEIK